MGNSGERKVTWLKEGIMGDDTCGHVDDQRGPSHDHCLCAFEEDEAES